MGVKNDRGKTSAIVDVYLRNKQLECDNEDLRYENARLSQECGELHDSYCELEHNFNSLCEDFHTYNVLIIGVSIVNIFTTLYFWVDIIKTYFL